MTLREESGNGSPADGESAADPQEPADGPQEPVPGPREPVADPQEPVAGPQEPVPGPREPVADPQRLMPRPQDPVANPQGLAPGPQKLVPGPQEPVAGPREPAAGPQEPAMPAAAPAAAGDHASPAQPGPGTGLASPDGPAPPAGSGALAGPGSPAGLGSPAGPGGPADLGSPGGPGGRGSPAVRRRSRAALLIGIPAVACLIGLSGFAAVLLLHGRPQAARVALPPVFRLRAGECVNSGPAGISSPTVVPCGQPHDAEIYASFGLAGHRWPGAAAVGAQARQGCTARLSGYLNPQLATSVLAESYVFPDQGAWNAGERTVICEIRGTAGKLTGSVRGLG
jgi:hypothetical protein